MLMLLTAVVVANAAPGAAAPPAVPALSAASTQAATGLVQLLGVREQLAGSMNQNVQMMRSGVAMRSMLAQQPGFVPAYNANKAKFDAALQKAGAIQAGIAEKVIRDNSAALFNAAVQSYARNYTLTELQALTAFFRTPAGQALNRKQPRISAEIGQASARLIGQKLDAAMNAAGPQLKAALAPLNSAAPPAKK